MIKLFSIIFMLCLALSARENPFFPAQESQELPMSSNLIQTQEPLKRATLTFPSTARSIEEVTVKYKNLDGTISQKSIRLNNSIDWHLPLFITQDFGSSSERENTPSKSNTTQSKYKSLASLKFIKVYAKNRNIKVITKDEMIRDFLLVKPHRIVCDFKRQIKTRSFVKKMPKANIVKEIRVGKHDGFYRLVLELDGYYKYGVQRTKEGYVFTLL